MYYNGLREKITAHYNNELNKTIAEIKTTTAWDILRGWRANYLLTPTTLAAIKELPSGDKLPEKIIEKITNKRKREINREIEKRFDRLHEVEEVEAPAAVSVVVEWRKNRTWGMNPRARVAAERVATYGSASGCGYDKQSAAIANAMNQNPEILKILYDHAEAGETFPYGVDVWAGLPSFAGGCGISCFYSIFEACGYTFRQVASGKAFDVYEITRN